MFIPDPDPDFYPSRIQGSIRHRIPDPDPQHCSEQPTCLCISTFLSFPSLPVPVSGSLVTLMRVWILVSDTDPDPACSCGCESGSYLSIWCGSMRIRIHDTDTHFKFFEITAWGRLAPKILVSNTPFTATVPWMIYCHCHLPDSSPEWPTLLAVHVNIQADCQPGEGGGGPIEQIPRINEIPAPAPNIPVLFACFYSSVDRYLRNHTGATVQSTNSSGTSHVVAAWRCIPLGNYE